MGSRTSAAALALVAAVALAGCGGKKAKLSSGDIASVCGVTITKAQFDEFVAEGKAEYRLRKVSYPAPGTAKYAELKKRIVAELVKEAAETREAGKLGVHVTDAQVQQSVQQNLIAARFKGSRKAYEKELAKEGYTAAEIEGRYRWGMIQKAAFDKVTAKLKVHDDAIEAYYAKNKAQYKSRPYRQVREIVVKTRKQADAIEAQLKAGADFATLAKKLSLDPAAKHSGGLQKLEQGTLTATYEKQVFALPNGKLTQPIPLPGPSFGIILTVGPVQPAEQVPLAQVRLAIVQYLLQQKQQKAFGSWEEGVKKRCIDKATYAKGYAPA